jgi:NAD(P)-dependent dehydrogenase (short-subunit alcohol dehydrogenase family)
VNVSSVYGVMGCKGMRQYDTTKCRARADARAGAEEAPHGIRVNAVCPDSTITPYHMKRAGGQGQSEAELRKRTANENLFSPPPRSWWTQGRLFSSAQSPLVMTQGCRGVEIAERIGYNVAQVSRTSAALRGGRRGRGCESGARRRDDALDDAGPGTRTADV